jgi:CubicO group peptidase (beta-lactamase class C family)
MGGLVSGMPGRTRGIIGTAVVAVTLVALTACTAEQKPTTIAVTAGDIPSEDIIALLGERDAAVESAVDRLPDLIEAALDESAVPGLAVAVVSDGEVVYTDAFGERDTSTGEPVDVDTVFQIASLSKPLSATVVAKAMTEGALTWNTPVHELLPEFALSDPYVTEHGVIGDYFSHRTGLPTGGGDDLEDIGFDGEVILDRIRMLPLSDFRNTYNYSNFGLTIGAEAAAAALGMTWEDAAEQLLFEPLGMTSTSTSHDDFLAEENRATLHAKVGDGFEPLYDRDPDPQAPAGGVSSTVGDLAIWMNMVLASGEFDGEPYIDPEALLPATSAQMISSHTSAVQQRPGHYGYGFNVGPTVSGRVGVGHSGAFSLGAATAAQMIPELDLGIVVLTNGGPVGLPEAVSAEFLDLVQYGEITRDWVSDMAGFFQVYYNPAGDLAEQEPPTNPALPSALAEYAGTYSNEYFGDLVVSVDGDGLVGALGPDGGYTFPLEPWDGDTWSFVPTGENAPKGSLSSAAFSRDGAQVTTVMLGYFDKWGLGTWVRSG